MLTNGTGEKIIAKEDRKEETLKEIVSGIYEVFKKNMKIMLIRIYPELDKKIPEKITIYYCSGTRR